MATCPDNQSNLTSGIFWISKPKCDSMEKTHFKEISVKVKIEVNNELKSLSENSEGT